MIRIYVFYLIDHRDYESDEENEKQPNRNLEIYARDKKEAMDLWNKYIEKHTYYELIDVKLTKSKRSIKHLNTLLERFNCDEETLIDAEYDLLK